MKLANTTPDPKTRSKTLADTTLNKSQKIRTLFLAGYSVKEIHEDLNIIYNHSYNIVSDLVRCEGLEVVKSVRGGKSKEIKRLLTEGRTPVEVATELKCKVGYVYKIRKDLEAAVVTDVKTDAK